MSSGAGSGTLVLFSAQAAPGEDTPTTETERERERELKKGGCLRSCTSGFTYTSACFYIHACLSI